MRTGPRVGPKPTLYFYYRQGLKITTTILDCIVNMPLTCGCRVEGVDIRLVPGVVMPHPSRHIQVPPVVASSDRR